MANIIFQQKDELRWVAFEAQYLNSTVFDNYIYAAEQTLLLLQADSVKVHLTPEQKEIFNKDLDKAKQLKAESDILFQDILKHNLETIPHAHHSKNLGYVQYPVGRLATKIQNAYIAQDHNLASHIQRPREACEKILKIIMLFNKNRTLFYDMFGTTNREQNYKGVAATPFDKLKSSCDPTRYNKVLKTLESLQKKHDSGLFISVERTTENSLIQKTAWALFATNNYNQQTGFVSKSGELGEISTARLFDSDQGAKRTGNSMGLSNWEVMEVEISLKKRLNFNPDYQNEKLSAALSILEKQKIEQFFKEVSMDKIQAKLQEVAANTHSTNSQNTVERDNTDNLPNLLPDPAATRKKHKI